MATADVPGTIEPGILYIVNEAKERLRAGPTTWAKLCERGLRIHKVGVKSYVLGDDLIQAVRQEGTADD